MLGCERMDFTSKLRPFLGTTPSPARLWIESWWLPQSRQRNRRWDVFWLKTTSNKRFCHRKEIDCPFCVLGLEFQITSSCSWLVRDAAIDGSLKILENKWSFQARELKEWVKMKSNQQQDQYSGSNAIGAGISQYHIKFGTRNSARSDAMQCQPAVCRLSDTHKVLFLFYHCIIQQLTAYGRVIRGVAYKCLQIQVISILCNAPLPSLIRTTPAPCAKLICTVRTASFQAWAHTTSFLQLVAWPWDRQHLSSPLSSAYRAPMERLVGRRRIHRAEPVYV